MSVRFGNIEQFDHDLKEFADLLHQDINTVVKKTAFEIYCGVVIKTPVDTGYARESWNISPHHPDSSTEDQSKYEEKTRVPFGKMSGLNRNKRQAVDRETEVTRWFITNNVPYITVLERGPSEGKRGGSIQSQHMVTRTLNEVQANIAQFIRNIGSGIRETASLCERRR